MNVSTVLQYSIFNMHKKFNSWVIPIWKTSSLSKHRNSPISSMKNIANPILGENIPFWSFLWSFFCQMAQSPLYVYTFGSAIVCKQMQQVELRSDSVYCAAVKLEWRFKCQKINILSLVKMFNDNLLIFLSLSMIDCEKNLWMNDIS